ncbi:MAG: hypothetical protein ACREJQ_00525 [bacterium]
MPDWKNIMNKVGQKASEMGKQAATETKKMVRLTDLSLQLRGAEGRQREHLQDLGQRVYEIISKGKAPETLAVIGGEIVNKLKTVENEIALFKAEIETVKKGGEDTEAAPPPGFEKKPAPPEDKGGTV